MKYKQKILNALQKSNFEKINDSHFKNEDLEVEFKEYDIHPKNKEGNETFPEDYCSLDAKEFLWALFLTIILTDLLNALIFQKKF